MTCGYCEADAGGYIQKASEGEQSAKNLLLAVVSHRSQWLCEFVGKEMGSRERQLL